MEKRFVMFLITNQITEFRLVRTWIQYCNSIIPLDLKFWTATHQIQFLMSYPVTDWLYAYVDDSNKTIEGCEKAMWETYLKAQEFLGACCILDLLTPEFVLDQPYNVIG